MTDAGMVQFPTGLGGRDATLRAVLAGFLTIGIAYRLYPLFAGDQVLATFFISEDGFLLMTVARNIAIGLGMSVSGGEIATNGVQPLATFLFALPYLLADGDKLAGIGGVILMSTAIAVAAAWALYRFALAGLRWLPDARIWAMCIALLWFLGPVPLLHTMNGLETGLNVLLVLCVMLVFARLGGRDGYWPLRTCIGLGLLFGVAFLTRIDNALLIAAVIATRLGGNLLAGRRDWLGNAREVIVSGAVSVLVGLPWLIYNQIGFGSIMPISGTAQSMTASLGANLDLVAGKLLESMLPFLGLPGAMERLAVVQIAAVLILLALAVLYFRLVFPRLGDFRYVVVAYLAHVLALAGYYGLFFGAPHFLSRYLAASAPLLFLMLVSVVLHLWYRWRPGSLGLARTLALAAMVFCVGAMVLSLRPGAKQQGHTQVVEWVRANVPEETWVGAVQTGTLGYWHDRTLNLDGKVNPLALQERAATNDVRNYVLRTEILYLADWIGINTWVDGSNPAFAEAFEVIVDDRKRNLGVLKRRD